VTTIDHCRRVSGARRIIDLVRAERAAADFLTALGIPVDSALADTPARMTKQISGWLNDEPRPLGVGVVIRAEHLCMSLRGVRARGTETVTMDFRGVLHADDRARAEFLAHAVGGGQSR
jgi:GTP cyclohydrolase I